MIYDRELKKIFAPRQLKKPADWIYENCTLRANLTDMPGSVRLFPYAVEPVNNLISPHIQRITLCWGSQTSKTLSMMAGMGYLLTEFPKDAIWIMPSASNALNFSKGRWLPFIEDCNALREQCPISVSSGRIDSDKITNMRQEFLTCTLTFAGAGSENNVKSAPVAYLVMDEIDEIDEDIRAAANERVKGRREFKVIQTSTPTLEKKGVWSEYLKGDQRKYNVPCPHCKDTFKFEWRQQEKKRYSVGFDEKAKMEDGSWDFDLIARTAHYRCPHCDGKILDAHKPDMLKAGEWIAENPHAPREHRSYHLNSLYSPVMTFANLMIKWLQSQGNNAELKKFIQGDLAEPWNDELVSHDGQSRAKELEADYERGDLKGEVRIIGADTQANDYRYIVRGFDRDGSNYLIDYGIAAGFQELDAKFEQHKCHKGIIDTGGNRTAEVYQEIYKRRGRWFGCKGFKTMAEPYRLKREDPFTGDQKGRAGRAKFLMLHVCKDVWEPEVVHLRSGKLKGFYTFADTPKDYYDQLFGAYWVEQSDKHGRKVVTRKTKNCGDHYLDCEVYARALSKFLGIARVDVATPQPIKDDDQPKQPKRTRNRSATSFW